MHVAWEKLGLTDCLVTSPESRAAAAILVPGHGHGLTTAHAVYTAVFDSGMRPGSTIARVLQYVCT